MAHGKMAAVVQDSPISFMCGDMDMEETKGGGFRQQQHMVAAMGQDIVKQKIRTPAYFKIELATGRQVQGRSGGQDKMAALDKPDRPGAIEFGRIYFNGYMTGIMEGKGQAAYPDGLIVALPGQGKRRLFHDIPAASVGHRARSLDG